MRGEVLVMKQWNLYLLMILFSIHVSGMEGFIPSKSSGFISVGGSFQQWSIEEMDDPIQQTVVPIVCFYPLTPNWYLNVSNSPAYAAFGNSSLSGISDTWIRTTYITPNEKFMLNLGIGAPTGKAQLSNNEYVMLMSLSENAFRFRLPSYGQGLNVKVGGGMAIPLQGKSVLGLGVNYIYKDAYNFLNGLDIEYNPGDEINIVTGISVPVGKQGKWSTDIIYSIYNKDKFSGDDLPEIDAGDKILVNTSLAYKLKAGFFYAAIRFRQRGNNDLYIPLQPVVSKKTIGDQIETDGLYQFSQWKQGGLSFIWDGRFYSDNEDGYGKATIYGFGLALQHMLTPMVQGKFQMKYLQGSISEINVTGIDVLAGVKISLQK